MKIVATTKRKKEPFKPITINLTITLEKEQDLRDIIDLGRAYEKGAVDSIYADDLGNYYDFPLVIVKELAKQL